MNEKELFKFIVCFYRNKLSSLVFVSVLKNINTKKCNNFSLETFSPIVSFLLINEK